MIDLKDYLDIPEGYYIEVGPVYVGGLQKDLIMQDLKVKKVGYWWFDRTVFSDYIFLDGQGNFKTGEDIELKKTRDFFVQVTQTKPVPVIPSALIRPGRHP